MSHESNSLHTYTAEQAKSKLDWLIEKGPLFDERGNKLPILGTFRSDTHAFMGPVTERYNEIQNAELFKLPEFTDGKLKFHSAGEVQGGESVWVKYLLPKTLDIGKVGDIVETSIVISTKHNGKGSLFFRAHALRLVCTNGMTASAGNHRLAFVRHNSGALFNLDRARHVIGHASRDIENFGELLDVLAKTRLDMDAMREITERVFYTSEESNIYTSAQKQNVAREVVKLFEVNDGDTFKKQRGTAYNLYNAYTNYADHHMTHRASKGETDEQARIRGILFGASEAFKHKALSEIVNVVRKRNLATVPSAIIADMGGSDDA